MFVVTLINRLIGFEIVFILGRSYETLSFFLAVRVRNGLRYFRVRHDLRYFRVRHDLRRYYPNAEMEKAADAADTSVLFF